MTKKIARHIPVCPNDSNTASDFRSPGIWQTQFPRLRNASGTGRYRRRIEIPAEWAGRSIVLVMEGVFHKTTILIDEAPAAKHNDGWTAIEVDLTDSAPARSALQWPRENCYALGCTSSLISEATMVAKEQQTNYTVKKCRDRCGREGRSGARLYASAWRGHPLALPQRDRGSLLCIGRRADGRNTCA
jgi:hypothetical protein